MALPQRRCIHQVCTIRSQSLLALTSSIAQLRLSQFTVHHRNFVDIQSSIPFIPPAAEKHNYDYEPYNPDLLPPIGEERMTHYFHHPDHADALAEMIQQMPKKRNEQIDPKAPLESRQGWGIHVVEDIMLERLLFLFVMVFAGASLAFGICWSVLDHDVAGAWTVSAWLSSLGGLVVGFVQYAVI